MTELARIQWQCRRGTKELDLLLNDYLENQYLQADLAEQHEFEELLKLDDAQLLSIWQSYLAKVKPRLQQSIDKTLSQDTKSNT